MFGSKPKSTKEQFSTEGKTAVRRFEADIERGLENLIRTHKKSGDRITESEVSKEVKKIYAKAWNDYAKKIGLSNMKLKNNCEYEYSNLQTKAITEVSFLDEDRKQRIFNAIEKLEKAKEEGKESDFSDLKKTFENLKGDVEANFLDSKINKIIKDLGRGETNVLESEEMALVFDSLKTIQGIDLGNLDSKAMIAVKKNQHEMLKTINEESKDIYNLITDESLKKEIGSRVTKSKVAFAALAAVGVVTAIIAAVLLSEVIAGVAVGGAVGAAVTEVVASSGAFLATMGVVVPAETVQIGLGAIAATTAAGTLTTGVVGLSTSMTDKAHQMVKCAEVQSKIAENVQSFENQVGLLAKVGKDISKETQIGA